MIVIVLNLILGIIIDTFADLRKEKQEKDAMRQNNCFICGLERAAFNNAGKSFERHVTAEHHLWNYFDFIVLLKTKDETEFTGPESFVLNQISQDPPNLDWFPQNRAMSLHEDTEEEDQNFLKALYDRLDVTTGQVDTLVEQLGQLTANLNRQQRKSSRKGISR